MQLIGTDITIIGCHDRGIPLDHRETHLLVALLNALTLTVHSPDAHMLQIHTIGSPADRIRLGNEFDRLTCRTNRMSCHLTTISIANRLQASGLIGDTIPTQFVAICPLHIGFYPQFATIEQQGYLLTIRVGIDRQLFASRPIPMVTHVRRSDLHCIPLQIDLPIDHTDTHNRLLAKETLEQIGHRFGLERTVEGTLCPSFGRPTATLTQVINLPPIGQADHLIPIHTEEVRAHVARIGLTLIEDHVREAARVAREIHIAVVVGGNVRLMDQGCRQRVGIRMTTARVHGHRNRACSIVATQ